ncbi:malonic semialdehyde reductase [Nocardiopsis coralliicola]
MLHDPAADTTADASTDDLLALGKDAQDLLFRAARTANTFSAEPVSDAQMRAVHDLVKYGPTAMNIQPLRVALLRSEESRRRIGPLMAEGNRAKTVGAPLVAVLATDHDFHLRGEEVFPGRGEVIAGAFADPAARTGAGGLNAALQAAYFIIGVRAAGLAAGPMAGFDAAGIDAEFFAGTEHRTFMVVNIGNPGADHPQFPRLPRFEFDDVYTEF